MVRGLNFCGFTGKTKLEMAGEEAYTLSRTSDKARSSSCHLGLSAGAFRVREMDISKSIVNMDSSIEIACKGHREDDFWRIVKQNECNGPRGCEWMKFYCRTQESPCTAREYNFLSSTSSFIITTYSMHA